MFGFFKKKRDFAKSPLAEERANRFDGDAWFKLHNATADDDWYAFHQGKHGYEDYAEGVIWIYSVRIYKQLLSIDEVQEYCRTETRADLIFIECAFFICLSIDVLARKGFLRGNNSSHSVFSYFAPSQNILNFIRGIPGFAEDLDFGEYHRRTDHYECKNMEVSDYWKALPHQFSRAIRNHVDNPGEVDVFTDPHVFTMYQDHNPTLNLLIGGIAGTEFSDCLNALTRVLYEFSDESI